MINWFLDFYINIQVAGQIVMVNITNLITHCECFTGQGRALPEHIPQLGVPHPFSPNFQLLWSTFLWPLPQSESIIGQKWCTVDCTQCSFQCRAASLSFLPIFTLQSLGSFLSFFLSDAEIQSITSQHHSKTLHILIGWIGVHLFRYAYTVNLHVRCAA